MFRILALILGIPEHPYIVIIKIFYKKKYSFFIFQGKGNILIRNITKLVYLLISIEFNN